MKISRFSHICIALNVYALMQYLLYHSEDVIMNKTRYFLGSGIPKVIADNIPNSVYFDTYRKSGLDLFVRRFNKLFLAFFSKIKYPELKSAEIYAQDHQYIASCLIGKQSYTLLSDSQQFFSIQMNPGQVEWENINKSNKSLSGRIEKILYGQLSVFKFGSSSQCKKVLLTKENKSILFDKLAYEIDSFEELWAMSSEKKRFFICSCFGVEYKDIDLLQNIDVVLLTQPLCGDGVLTEQEHLDVYQQVIDNYLNMTVMIKPHPRDTIDYKRYFADCVVFDKPIPMEMLALLGANVKIAATLFSSSVYCLGDSVRVDWYGTTMHHKLLSFYGKL